LNYSLKIKFAGEILTLNL